MSEWKKGILSEIAEIIMGQSPRGESCNQIGKGKPLLNGPTEFGVKNPIPVQFTDEPTKVSKNGDILFCVRGSTTGRMNWADQEFVIGRGLAAIRHRHGKDCQYFVKGIIDFNLPTLLASATGSTFPNVSRDQLENLHILLPPLPEQRAIASVLSSLDDKIDLLHRQNKTLEVMAETLFRQWFMEEADDGWEEGKLEDIALFFNGKSRPSEGGSIPIYGGNGILGCTNVSNYSEKSIIVGRVGAYCGSLYFESRDIWVSDNALLVKPKNKNQTHYLFYLLKTLDLNSMAEGSSHPLLTQTLLKSIDITLPSKEKIIDFDNQLEQWTTKIELNRSQIHILEKIRGTLLPKLMSGEIKINTDNVIPVRGGQNENRTH